MGTVVDDESKRRWLEKCNNEKKRRLIQSAKRAGNVIVK
jgi:hypothetical protein